MEHKPPEGVLTEGIIQTASPDTITKWQNDSNKPSRIPVFTGNLTMSDNSKRMSKCVESIEMSQDELDLKVINSLTSLFRCCDTKIVVRKMIRATKKLYSRELEVIMGEEYPKFQNLPRKEKICRLGTRCSRLFKGEVEIFQEAEKRKKEKETRRMQEKKEEAELKKEMENTVKSLLNDANDASYEENKNDSAITVNEIDQSKFNEILFFWKDIDAGKKMKLLCAMKELDTGQGDSNRIESTVSVTTDRAAPEDHLSCTTHIAGFSFYRISIVIIVAVVGLLLFLLFQVWSWREEVEVQPECGYSCFNITEFLQQRALELFVL